MARKDNIFKGFLDHDLITEKYGIPTEDIPDSLSEGLKSDHIIIKTIAQIVESSESYNPLSDRALYTKIIQFLNSEAI